MRVEHLNEDQKEAVQAAEQAVNMRRWPDDVAVVQQPILKPFNWAAVPEEMTVGEVPYWIARFERDEAGKYVFKALFDN